jgi:two-component system response regulator FixJ
MQAEAIVHIVDDDQAIRDSLKLLMKSVGFESMAYESAETFLKRADLAQPGCLIVDIRMQGMNGLELQQLLNDRNIKLPVIIITGHGDIPMAVQAIKAGAVDFLEKPFDNEVLITRIRQSFKEATREQDKESRIAEARAKIAQLTPREREVMNFLVAGKHNKAIADEMNISIRTAEAHRAKVMKKLHADSLSDVVRIALLQPRQ